MIARALHRLAAQPGVYDLTQCLVGVPRVRRRVAARIAGLGLSGVVVDLGGGTGMFRSLWPSPRCYVCLDLDPAKLRRFRRKFPADATVLADATRAPFAPGSVDVVVCVFIAHHLADDGLSRLLDEGARVLRPGGRLVFLDPVWDPDRPLARLLWRYDRGSYPRTGTGLRRTVARRYDILHWEQFAVVHGYALGIAARRADPGDAS